MKKQDVIDMYLFLRSKLKEFKDDEEGLKIWYTHWLENLSKEERKILNYKKKHPEIVCNYLKTKKIPKVKLKLEGSNHFCLIRDHKTNYVYLVISDIENKLQILKWSENCNHPLNEEFDLEENWLDEIFPYMIKDTGEYEYSFGYTEKIVCEIKNNKIIFKSGIYEK